MNKDTSLRHQTSGNRVRRTGKLLTFLAPLLLVAACSGSASEKSSTESSSGVTASSQGHYPTGSIGLDSLTTGESIVIGDSGQPNETFTDEYDGVEVVTRIIDSDTAEEEGWKWVENSPDGTSGLGLANRIDELQSIYGLENVTTGNAVDESTGEATGLPGEVGVWVNPTDFDESLL